MSPGRGFVAGEEQGVEAAAQVGEVAAAGGEPPELAGEVIDVAAVGPVPLPALGAKAGPPLGRLGVGVQRGLPVGVEGAGDLAVAADARGR